MAQPDNALRLRRALLVLLLVWAVVALSRFIWALVPSTEPLPDAVQAVINPIDTTATATVMQAVDLEQMLAWHLFGKPGASVPDAPQVVEVQENPRDGIEDGARETRLNLLLRGIVASTEDGLGHAIIENRKKQQVYAVGDKLPVPGNVSLAKVMPRQVVLDNGGTYELLVLFEASQLGKASAAPRPPPRPATEVDRRADEATTNMAKSYRQRLFSDPQSLADVVNVTAVREGGTLLGYRVSPGKDQQQFTQLGFKSGDLVMAVNGISLDNPANTMVLYTDMRSATEAVFELQRGDQALTLSVNLDSGAVE
ncbi:MAG: type II secretion system protein GspC [Halioglobus sp.]|nr:type II secretion system protein GspC [Halioglobus sp.]